MNVTIFGAGGRMGRTVTRLAHAAADVTIVGAVDHHGAATLGRDVGDVAGVGSVGVAVSEDVSSALLGADVVIDFSTAAAFAGMLRAAAAAGVAVVSGTTQLAASDHALMAKAGAKVALLWAPNMSVAMQLMADLLQRAMVALGAGYDLELVEAHHRRKVDAPSGSANLLLAAAQAVRPGLVAVHGRHGQPGARGPNEVGVHALRGGGVVGDHSAHLIGAFDRLEITHRALNRDLFAQGALRAARFVAAAGPGLYSLREVLAAAEPAAR
ncbi:MAG TPA: 4-hydroxy-tetrahydrodipicolinate reductase [Sorangium sp.]|nr:4-hydroxy-tetrahydrodipicolinate reductase [Sorangium sp.]